MNKNRFGTMTKMYVALSFLTLVIFMLISTGSMIFSQFFASPYPSMKGVASTVSNRLFVDMLAMEVPMLRNEQKSSTLDAAQVAPFLFRYFTQMDPADPKSLIAVEIPGISEQTTLLRSSQHNEKEISPLDYAPPNHALTPMELNVSDVSSSTKVEQNEQIEAVERETIRPGPKANDMIDNELESSSVPNKTDHVKAFIYHSHNRESWLPELGKEGQDFSEAFDDEVNITLLGKRMEERLEEHGIGALSSDKDYPTEVEGYNWNFSYKYSLETVKEAMAENPELEYFFDIHRDAQAREKTTVTINGTPYAQIYFIIGRQNPNWESNEAFAAQIHERLEEQYPGISRGIWGKNQQSGHGEYNQSVSPNSILIEVGGPENTLEECYRTIDVLSDVIAEIFWEAEEVNAPVSVTDQDGADRT